MSKIPKRVALVLGVTALCVAAVLVGVQRASHGTAASKLQTVVKAGDPDALQAKGAYAVGPESRDPDTAEEEQAALRAYPATVLPVATAIESHHAYERVKGHAKKTDGDWKLIGPSEALYPPVLNQFLGDGAPYVTSGRVTALALAPNCDHGHCVLYVAAAGGGIWRTDKALSGTPKWEFISGSFGTNAIGTLLVDQNDHSGRTLYAGTGEPNASGDSESGVGIYRSTDGGDSWTLLPGSAQFLGRSLASLQTAPNGDILVGVARGVRGVSSVSGGATSAAPGAIALGLYRSQDGGGSFTQIWDGAGSIRGVNEVRLDPTTPTTIYAASFQQGVWRSLDDGGTWAQIMPPLNPAFNTDRAEFDVTTLAGGATRMYVGIGASGGAIPARFYRSDDANTAATFADLTTPQVENYCTAQCWYDNGVYTPAGHPDVVYTLGSFDYGQNPKTGSGVSNGRGVLLSSDGGATWSDQTKDGDRSNSDAIHPDQHAIVTIPGQPFLFFEGSDGGVVHTDGKFADVSYKCDERGLSAAGTAYCKSLLSRVPKQIIVMNKGLSTLQFQSLSFSASRPLELLQGGTQDNGTFVYQGSTKVWPQEIYGDGGQSGFNASDDNLRFNTFTGQASDVNFRGGDPEKWVIATGPIAGSPESSLFYPPIISDPTHAYAGSIFQGSQSVWRTQDWGGDRDFLEANCPEFTANAADPTCGDFVRIGGAPTTDLTSPLWGDRAGGNVGAIERSPVDTGTLWVATTTGRLFVSHNANDPADAVTFQRLDTFATNDPGRFVSSIYPDPAHADRAWLSYSGYNFNTPAEPGHVFEVTATAASATWTNLDGGTGPMGDLPVTDLVRDDLTGTLYASTDFGVLKYVDGSWVVAGSGMPMVEIAGLTIVPSARVLYAATHGRSAWRLDLGKAPKAV